MNFVKWHVYRNINSLNKKLSFIFHFHFDRVPIKKVVDVDSKHKLVVGMNFQITHFAPEYRWFSISIANFIKKNFRSHVHFGKRTKTKKNCMHSWNKTHPKKCVCVCKCVCVYFSITYFNWFKLPGGQEEIVTQQCHTHPIWNRFLFF